MTSKHTPGPWVAHSLMVSEAGHTVGRGRDICHCGIGMRLPSDSQQSMANARLIAAAPELLEVSKELVRALELAYGIKADYSEDRIYDELPSGSIAMAFLSARTSIAKATGAA